MQMETWSMIEMNLILILIWNYDLENFESE